MTEEQELRAWLRLNRNHFLLGDYGPDEVAWFARMNDFSPILICKILSHFNDALGGTNFDNRINMHVTNETNTIEHLSGKVDLSEQWYALSCKLNYDMDFDEVEAARH